MWNIYKAISEWIRFSDVKAASILAIHAILWGFIASNARDIQNMPSCPHCLWLSLGGICFLITSAISIILAIVSIHPTLKVGESPSHIYFAHIAKRISRHMSHEEKKNQRDKYVNELTSLSDREVNEEIAHQIWAIAIVAWRKYRLVSWAIKFLFVSLLIFFIGILAFVYN